MWISSLIVVFLLVLIVATGTFRRLELIGVAMGSTQVLFFLVMFLVRPDWEEVAHGLVETHFDDGKWLKLLAANIGAVIMPWMLFYQQSACCERKMTVREMISNVKMSGSGRAKPVMLHLHLDAKKTCIA